MIWRFPRVILRSSLAQTSLSNSPRICFAAASFATSTKATSKKAAGKPAGLSGSFELKWAETNNVPVSSILKSKHTIRWVDATICQDTAISKAIRVFIERGLGAMMVVDRESNVNQLTHMKGKVLGMLTSRDLLRRINAESFSDSFSTYDSLLDSQISEFVTPLNRVIFIRPEESVRKARQIMGKVGVKCLPVISKDGRVEGILTARDIADYHFGSEEKGGKRAYLDSLTDRVGLSNTSMAEPSLAIREQIREEEMPLYVNSGVALLPHPFKTEKGVASNRRAHGPQEFSSDDTLSEDAYFLKTVKIGRGTKRRSFSFGGVADGVGSWRQYGVDPRLFSKALMKHCEEILDEKVKKGKATVENLLRPQDLVEEAHKRVIKDDIVGSCTSCVSVFDEKSHQIHFTNLGDSGIIVLRHIDIEDTVDTDENKTNLRVAYVSQQQLKEFNFPYQLGWTGKEITEEDGDGHAFKGASDFVNHAIHVRRGDIILCASDGLFDNVSTEEISRICFEWEYENGFIDKRGDISKRQERWSKGVTKNDVSRRTITDLAVRLTERARELSLDSTIDSPFAILAKDNDIMWSGGMPDDCTVIAYHVVGGRD